MYEHDNYESIGESVIKLCSDSSVRLKFDGVSCKNNPAPASSSDGMAFRGGGVYMAPPAMRNARPGKACLRIGFKARGVASASNIIVVEQVRVNRDDNEHWIPGAGWFDLKSRE